MLSLSYVPFDPLHSRLSHCSRSCTWCPTDSNCFAARIRQQTKPRGALKSLFNFNFKCTLFFMNALCDSPARQSAGQINKIKWQTHYKASGSQAGRQASDGKWQERNGRAKWQRHGNKSATGSTCSNNATLAAQNSTLHKKMANNARRSKGTMVAQHTTDCRR